MFGPREEVQAYAKQHSILKLVDELVNELLQHKPCDPLAHLACYIDGLRGAAPATDVEKNKLAAEGSTAACAEVSHPSSTSSSLEAALGTLWDACRPNHATFKERFEEDVSQGLRDVLATVFAKAGKAKGGQAGKGQEAKDTPVQTHLKFDASPDVTQANAAQREQLVDPYSAEYRPTQSVSEVVDGLADWFGPGRKLWPRSAVDRVKHNCTFMQHKHNYGEVAEVVVPLFIYSIAIMTEYTWAFWVSSDGHGRWTPFSSAHAVVLEKDFLAHCTKDGAPLCGEDEDLTRPRGLPLAPLNSTITEARRALARVAEDTRDEGTTPSRQPASAAFELPTQMQVVFCDGRMVGGSSSEGDERGRGFAGKVGGVFAGWEGLTVFVSTPFLEGCRCRGDTTTNTTTTNTATTDTTKDVAKELYIARYKLADVRAEYEDAHTQGTADAETLASLKKRVALHPYSDSVAWLPAPSCIFEGLHTATADVQRTQTMSLSLARLPPPGVLEYLQSRRTCEHLEIAEGGLHYLRSEDVFACRAREEKVLLAGRKDKAAGTETAYVRCDDSCCFFCAVGALKDRCVREKNQQQYDKGCKEDLDALSTKHKQDYSPFQALVAHKVAIAVREAPEGQAPTPLTILHALDIQAVYWSSAGVADWTHVEPLHASLSGKNKFIAVPGADGPPCVLYKSCCEFADQPYYVLNASMRDTQNKAHKTQITVTCKDKTSEVFCARSVASLGKGMGTLREVARKHATLRTCLRDLMTMSHQTCFESETSGTSLWYTSRDIIDDKKKDDALPPSDEDYLDPVHYSGLGYYRYTARYDTEAPEYMEPSTVRVQMGDWVSGQVRPLLFYVNEAMKEMSPVLSYRGWRCAPETEQKCYRGLGNARLPPELYSTGNVVVWSAFSSTSTDQGISQFYASSASGMTASVFIVTGSSCRLIAPWSRFGREEEWLFPLNSMFKVDSMLTEDQQSILGKKDFQLFEISEVDELSMEKIRIRCSLASAQTKEVARVVFSAVSAVDSGNGVLDVSLKSASEGCVDAKWVYTFVVKFDALQLSPVMTSNSTKLCTDNMADSWSSFLSQAHKLNRFTHEHPCVIFDQSSEEGRQVLNAVSLVLGLRHSKALTFVEVTCHLKPSKAKDAGSLQEENASSGYYQLKAMNSTEQWEVSIEMRREDGQEGYAFGHSGAVLLHQIIAKQVHLVRIDIRNNGVGVEGAELLLQALRVNRHVVQLSICDTEQQKQKQRPLQVRDTHTCDAEDGDDPHLGEIAAQRMMHIQQVINIRCAHNRGTIVSSTFSDLGDTWPQCATEALYDVDVVDMAFSDLFDTRQREAVLFIRLLQKAVDAAQQQELAFNRTYPKLPGALVAAARWCDLCDIKLLLDMHCNPFETDAFGETPQLKMWRRLNRDTDTHLIRSPDLHLVVRDLHVCLDRLQPTVFRYNEPLWKVKNFALEVMRMADDRDHISLAAELIHNVCTSYEAWREEAFPLGYKPPDFTAGDYSGNVKRMIQDTLDVCKECSVLNVLQCPLRRQDASLFCLKVICSRGNELFPIVHGEVGMTEMLDGRLTGRKTERGVRYQSYAEMCSNKHVHENWSCLVEAKLPRRMDKNGIHYFEHEVALQDTEPWSDMQEADVCSTHRIYEGSYVTKQQYLDMVWNTWDVETDQIRRQNRDGFFVFKHDWDEDMEGGAWEDGKKETLPTLPTLVEQLRQPSLNLYDPTVFGSRIEMEESRAQLRTWSRLWGAVNAVLVTSVEKERVLFRKVENVTDIVLLHHLHLKRGELYCQPDITLWDVERRYVNCTLGDDNDIVDARRPRTKVDFTSDFNDKSGRLWKASERRWTGRGGEEAAYEGELCYEHEFKYKCMQAHKQARKERGEDVGFDLNTLLRWEDAKPEEPFLTYPPGEQVEVDTHVCSTMTTILFSAHGKMHGECVGLLSDGHDFLLPALEMFVVEDVQARGTCLHVSLVSRGSLLRTDKELRAWCSSIQNTGLDSVWGKNGDMDECLRPESKTAKDDILYRQSFLSADECDVFFSRKSQMLHGTERQVLVHDLEDVVRPVNAFASHKMQGANGQMTNHVGCTLPEAVPTTYRPGKTFLSGLNRKKRSEGDHTAEGMTRAHGNELAHIPDVELVEDWEKDMDVNDVVTVSGASIQAYHDEHTDEDAYFKTTIKGSDTPGQCPPPVSDVYGGKEFRITVGEVQQLLKTTTIVTSPSLPLRFVQCLIGSFTSAKRRLLFFNVFRATSLLSIDEDWEAAKIVARYAAMDALEMSELRKRQARELGTRDNTDLNSAKLYRNLVLIEINKQILAYLDGKLDDDGAEPIEVTRDKFTSWMDTVQAQHAQYGFTSKAHARLTLAKSMVELGTEMCVSQQGFSFTSGTEGEHSQLCEKTHHSIAILAATGMGFCYPGPTLREAPKYFVNIPRKGQQSHEGWAYFQEGKQREFVDRLKVLYTCIFESARKQRVRNMCAGGMGLGISTQNLGNDLRLQVAEMYFRAQFELLAEQDWGFENVCISSALS